MRGSESCGLELRITGREWELWWWRFREKLCVITNWHNICCFGSGKRCLSCPTIQDKNVSSQSIYLFIYFGSMRIQELERLKQPKIQWGRGKIGKLGRARMASRWAGRRLHGWALEMMSPAFLIMGMKTFCYSYQLPSTEFDACIHAKNMDRVLMRDTQDSYWKVIRAFLDTTNNLIKQEGLYLQVAWFQI